MTLKYQFYDMREFLICNFYANWKFWLILWAAELIIFYFTNLNCILNARFKNSKLCLTISSNSSLFKFSPAAKMTYIYPLVGGGVSLGCALSCWQVRPLWGEGQILGNSNFLTWLLLIFFNIWNYKFKSLQLNFSPDVLK